MKDLGEFLKAERLRQGVELDTITQQTCISRSMLMALEEGDSGKIGTPLLVRSFTRAYCRVLGIDPTVVLERYTGETPRHERLDEGIRRYRERSLASRERYRLRAVMVMMTVITIGAVYFTAIWLPKRDSGRAQWNQELAGGDRVAFDVVPAPAPEEKADTSDSAAEDSTGAQPEAAGAEPTSQIVRRPVIATDNTQSDAPPAGKPGVAADAARPVHRLKIDAQQESWVEVRLDDKKVEGVLLSPGQSREWTVEKGLRVLVGNAGGVRLTWDGKKLRSLGKAGHSARLRLPEDAARF